MKKTDSVAHSAYILLVSGILMMTRSQQLTNDAQISNSCTTPTMPMNGQVSCMSVHIAGLDTELLCTYTCDSGYKFKGHSDTSVSRLCSRGVFTDDLDSPQCISVCADPELPAFVSLSCEGNITSKLTCKAQCQTSYRFEIEPEGNYVCLAGRTWFPELSSMPRCLRNQETVLNTGISVCAAWGQDHYRTFDNNIYTFKGNCKYVLAYMPNTFSIMVANDPTCTNDINCKRSVEVYFGENTVTLRSTLNGSVVLWNDEVFPVPGSRGGTVIEKVGSYITVRSSLKFSIKWDGSQSVFIKVSEELKGQISGLCGRFNDDPADDFENDKGNVVTSVASFATSWKKTELNADMCMDSIQAVGCRVNTPEKASMELLAKSKCGDLLRDSKLKPCHMLVDPGPYLEACMVDCCERNTSECVCDSMEAYSRACLEQSLEVTWRRPDRCEVHCTGGMVFKECGSSCVPDCSNMDAGCSDPICVDGCFCPDGWVMHKGQCIESKQCPCTRGSSEYEHGSIINEECNSCSCVLGKWNCTHKDCDAVCSVMGDPHYTTFDGRRYDFMGMCSYYLVHTPDFNIVTDNIRCGNSESACTRSLSIDFKELTVKLDRNHQLIINGDEIVNLPYQTPEVQILMISSLFMQVVLSNGVSVMWDGRTRAYIKVPPSLKGQTQGLCGTYDGRQNNDFLTPQGSTETNTNLFGNQWKTIQDCADVPLGIVSHPCETQSQRKVQAAQLCGQLKGSLFEACHDLEDVTQYYTDCTYDLCTCAENIQDCLCPSLATYADVCAARGIKINWRLQVKECMLQCPGGQVYQVCGKPCEHTCHTLAQNTDSLCDLKCVEGCSCPENQSLNNHGECVSVDQCPCTFDGTEYPAGFTTLKGTDFCVCTNAQWQCSRMQPDSQNISRVQSLCAENMEYSSCASSCPVTCENVESALTCDRDDHCQPGCVCKTGYVFDGDKCILPSMCPCYHGGKTYYEGNTFFVDCNECTCKNRKWQCENNDCPATCSAYGDSHYTTFDSRTFEFQGSCDYIMTKSTTDNPNKFLITTTNLQCGTSGVACSKGIEFTTGIEGTVSFYRLQLIRGKKVSPDPGSPFSVREIGEMVYVTTPFGVSIQWDKGTRVYVRLSILHIGKVEGLCGNYNGNQNDDFQMRSGGLPVAKATSFGDSWRVHSTCETSKEIVDTCLLAPHRKSWAQHRCAVIASDLFEPCHTLVDPKDYIERCEFDACGCDMGGDCECLCTAIAAYAHECANQGMPIKWRSKDLCGLICSNCTEYNPCISLCPKETCDNSHNYSRIAESCEDEDLCFEGCDFHTCPEGQVYDSLVEPVNCVPRPLCGSPPCVIGDKKYRDGERIENADVCNPECEICICRHGSIEHISFGTCSANTKRYPPTTPVSQTVPEIFCAHSGWTGWMSSSVPTYANVGDQENLPRLRAKYTFCHDSQITGIRCRVISQPEYGMYFGQKLTCDLNSGLVCYHKDQAEGLCLDYEVSFNCSCDTTSTTSSEIPPSSTSSISSTSFERCNWTQWMNSYSLSNQGDIESISNLRLKYAFCTYPTDIICRTVPDIHNPKGIRYDQAGQMAVTCDLNRGLVCLNSAQISGQSCYDYEVAVLCGDECTIITTPVTPVTGIRNTSVSSGTLPPSVATNSSVAVDLTSTTVFTTHHLMSTSSHTTDASTTVPTTANTEVISTRQTSTSDNSSVTFGSTPLYSGTSTTVIYNYTSTPGHTSSPSTLHVISTDGTVKTTGHSFPQTSSTVATTKELTTRRSTDHTPCTPVTMEDKACEMIGVSNTFRISNDQLEASSSADVAFDAHNGRLKNTANGPSNGGAWMPRASDLSPHLIINLKDLRKVAGVVTQGRPDFPEWVKSYTVAISKDGSNFSLYCACDSDTPKVFVANSDSNSIAKAFFDRTVWIRKIAIYPVEFVNAIAMRVDLLTCDDTTVTIQEVNISTTATSTSYPTSSAASTDTRSTRYPDVTSTSASTSTFGVTTATSGTSKQQTSISPPYSTEESTGSVTDQNETTLQQQETTTHSSGSTVSTKCQWSEWLNADKPNSSLSDSGDLETIEVLKSKFHVCPDIKDIECRVAGSATSALDAGQAGIKCDIFNGLRCYNMDTMNGLCWDYEVRVCWDSNTCQGSTTPPPVKTATTTTATTPFYSTYSTVICPPGEEWDPCAYKCDEVCHYMGHAAGACSESLLKDCVPGCRSGSPKCPQSQRLLDQNSCVNTMACTCLKPDGTTAIPFDSWIDSASSCLRCSCFNNEVVCVSEDGCTSEETTEQIYTQSTTEATSTARTTKPTRIEETTEATSTARTTKPTRTEETTEATRTTKPTRTEETTEATSTTRTTKPTRIEETTEATSTARTTKPTRIEETTEATSTTRTTKPTRTEETTEATRTTKPTRTEETTEATSTTRTTKPTRTEETTEATRTTKPTRTEETTEATSTTRTTKPTRIEETTEATSTARTTKPTRIEETTEATSTTRTTKPTRIEETTEATSTTRTTKPTRTEETTEATSATRTTKPTRIEETTEATSTTRTTKPTRIEETTEATSTTRTTKPTRTEETTEATRTTRPTRTEETTEATSTTRTTKPTRTEETTETTRKVETTESIHTAETTETTSTTRTTKPTHIEETTEATSTTRTTKPTRIEETTEATSTTRTTKPTRIEDTTQATSTTRTTKPTRTEETTEATSATRTTKPTRIEETTEATSTTRTTKPTRIEETTEATSTTRTTKPTRTVETTEATRTTKPTRTEETTEATSTTRTTKPTRTEETTETTRKVETTESIHTAETTEATSTAQTAQTTRTSRCYTWSSWINDDKPNTGSGDSELIPALHSKYSLCSAPSAVECRVANTNQDFHVSGQRVSCTQKDGLRCLNADNGGKCKDYEIRVFCPCTTAPVTELTSVSSIQTSSYTTSSTDKSSSSSSQNYTTSSEPTSTNGLSSQFLSTVSSSVGSSSTPNSTTSGSSISSSTSLSSSSGLSSPTDTTVSSSPGSTIYRSSTDSTIYRSSPDSTIYRSSTDTSSMSSVFSTSRSSGTSATKVTLPEKSDVTTSSIVTSSSTPLTVPTVSTNTTTPLTRIICSWTNWMSDHSSDAFGDMETILHLRHNYAFCNTSDILAVRCRDRKTKKTPEELGQLNVLCEINPGLVCINSNQLLGQCADYEVSFLCDPHRLGCTFQTTTTDETIIHGGTTVLPTSTTESTTRGGTSVLSTGTTESTTRGGTSVLSTGTTESTTRGGTSVLSTGTTESTTRGGTSVLSTGTTESTTRGGTSVFSTGTTESTTRGGTSVLSTGTTESTTRGGTSVLSTGTTESTTPGGTSVLSTGTTESTTRGGTSVLSTGTTESTTRGGTSVLSTGTTESTSRGTSVLSTGTTESTTPGGTSVLSTGTTESTSRGGTSVLSTGTTESTSRGGTSVLSTGTTESTTRGGTSVLSTGTTKSTTRGGTSVLSTGTTESTTPGGTSVLSTGTTESTTPGGTSVLSTGTTESTTRGGTSVHSTDTTETVVTTTQSWSNGTASVTSPHISTVCQDQLLLTLPGSRLSVSSSLSLYSGPDRARIDSQANNSYTGAWIPMENSNSQWIQVMFPVPVIVTGITTQGRQGSPEWIKTYKALYSLDGSTFSSLLAANGQSSVFTGNSDSDTKHTEKTRPTEVLVVMIQPETWEKRIALRFELLGCPRQEHPYTEQTTQTTTNSLQSQCFSELCKQNVDLRGDMLSASSFRDAGYAPGHARLGDTSCWIPDATDVSPYIQVKFMTWQLISGITTQGHASASLFVRTFVIRYSTDGIKWHPYREVKGQDKIFYGNVDSTTPVRNFFQLLIHARYIRIIPQSWNHDVALRFQLHGCAQTSHDESYISYPARSAAATTTTATAEITNIYKSVDASENENCTEWDQWLDLNQPNLTHRDEIEPIADLIANSLFCKNPMAIDCRPDPFVRPQTNAAMMSCNLWEGFKCLVSDGNGPVCNNYKVRLGCLKETPECTSKLTNHSPVPVCFPDLDTSFCPESCQQGFYCNGTKCVPKSSCPCNINHKIVMPQSVERNENCEICQCLSGEIMCAQMPQCPPCAKGISYRDTSSCECQCLTCEANEYQCGDGSCISGDRKCDCIIDCIDDELGCNSTKMYTTSTTMASTELVTNSTVVSTTTSVKETTSQPTVVSTTTSLHETSSQPTEVVPQCTYIHNYTTALDLLDPLTEVKVYKIGETWSDGPCKNCSCTNVSSIMCTEHYCPACPLGEERAQTSDSCCGRCIQVGCVVDSHVYKVGELLPSSKKCYTATCEKSVDTFMIHETQVFCETSLPYCLPGVTETEAYDITGCCHMCTTLPPPPTTSTPSTCKTCSPQLVAGNQNDTIGYFKVALGNVTCQNKEPIPDLKQCGGYCGSSSWFTQMLKVSDSDCTCCQPTRTVSRSLQLHCSDGEHITKYYIVPETCACMPCSGGA